MKKLILILSLVATFSAFGKTVDVAAHFRLTHCAKNVSCLQKDSAHNFSITLAPLADTGLDYGIGDLTVKSPIQKFGFKVIASSMKSEDQAEIVFLVMDESYKVSTFTLIMKFPEVLNVKLRLASPVFTDRNGSTSSLSVEVESVETKN